jgi:cytochrome c-type biogenesis protein
MDVVTSWWISFLAGVFTPLGAVCVLPLYPGFIAHLAGQLPGNPSRRTILLLGCLVAVGMVGSMLLTGFVFISILQFSLSDAIRILSPIAFILLVGISIFLIAGKDPGKYVPSNCLPEIRSPILTAFVFGFFFGILALPCNPGPIIVLFALSVNSFSFMINLVNFILFGIGMALPLIFFSVITASRSDQVIHFFTENRRIIQRIAGILMLVIALYYLGYIFGIF